MLFVGYLVQGKKKSSTIKSYISAIRSVLKEDDEVLNENKYLLTSLTKACRYINDHVRTRLPIKKHLLNQILQTIHKIYLPDSQPYLVTLYKAIFSTAYFGLFRIGELTESHHAANGSNHAVKAKDVHIGTNKMKMLFVLRTSKMHWHDAKPQTIKICSNEITDIQKDKSTPRRSSYECPFKILQDYLKVRRKFTSNDDEQFFIFRDRSPVTAMHFRGVLRRTILALGLDDSLYSSQSLRAGRACDLADFGVSLESIRDLGRWSSGAIFTYLKL